MEDLVLEMRMKMSLAMKTLSALWALLLISLVMDGVDLQTIKKSMDI